MGLVDDWLASGRSLVAAALRGAAATLEGLANWIEVPGSAPAGRREAVTRARIAASLDRARSGYVRATAPARRR